MRDAGSTRSGRWSIIEGGGVEEGTRSTTVRASRTNDLQSTAEFTVERRHRTDLSAFKLARSSDKPVIFEGIKVLAGALLGVLGWESGPLRLEVAEAGALEVTEEVVRGGRGRRTTREEDCRYNRPGTTDGNIKQQDRTTF